MDNKTAQDWLGRYVDAWNSYDRADISGLFSEDVAYRYHPYDEPIVGRDAVVASWLGELEPGDASTVDARVFYDAPPIPDVDGRPADPEWLLADPGGGVVCTCRVDARGEARSVGLPAVLLLGSLPWLARRRASRRRR